MTKSEQFTVIDALLTKYFDIGNEIKDRVLQYKKEFNEGYPITENDFFSCFAPLYGDQPEEFKEFKECFEITED